MTNEEVRAILKLFARQLEIAAELKKIREAKNEWKCSRRRPLLIPAKDFGENWAKIFEKPKQKEQENDIRTNGEANRPDAEVNSTTETDGRDAL